MVLSESSGGERPALPTEKKSVTLRVVFGRYV